MEILLRERVSKHCCDSKQNSSQLICSYIIDNEYYLKYLGSKVG